MRNQGNRNAPLKLAVLFLHVKPRGKADEESRVKGLGQGAWVWRMRPRRLGSPQHYQGGACLFIPQPAILLSNQQLTLHRLTAARRESSITGSDHLDKIISLFEKSIFQECKHSPLPFLLFLFLKAFLSLIKLCNLLSFNLSLTSVCVALESTHRRKK